MTAVKTVYSADALLRIRGSVAANQLPPSLEDLPEGCKSLFVRLNDTPNVAVVRHTKKADVSRDSDSWNVSSSAGKVIDLSAEDRERLLSIRQSFGARFGGGMPKSNENVAPPNGAQRAAHQDSIPVAREIAPAQGPPPGNKFSGWGSQRPPTAQEFYEAIPKAPLSRAEQRRQQEVKQGSSSPSQPKVVTLNKASEPFIPAPLRQQPNASTIDPVEWYTWWVSQSTGHSAVPLGDGAARGKTRRAKRNPQHNAASNSPQSDSDSSEEEEEGNDKPRARRGGVKHRKKMERRLMNAQLPAQPQGKEASQGGKKSADDVARDTRCRPASITEIAKDRRIFQRERQVALGTRTLGYLVMMRMLERGLSVHDESFPPPTRQPCSKRSWDGQMRRWRQRLHIYDEHASEYLSPEEIAAHAHRRQQDKDEEEELDASADDLEESPAKTDAPQATHPVA